MLRPICAKCKIEMRVQKNGVVVKCVGDGQGPCMSNTRWSGDKFKCPHCGVEIITSFGKSFESEGDAFEFDCS